MSRMAFGDFFSDGHCARCQTLARQAAKRVRRSLPPTPDCSGEHVVKTKAAAERALCDAHAKVGDDVISE